MRFVNLYAMAWQGRELLMDLCDVCLTRHSEYDDWKLVRDGTRESSCAVCGAKQIAFRCARDRARYLVEALFTGE